MFGVVGESGCGKSMTGLALMGMVPRPGQVQGSIRLEGRELIGLPELRGRVNESAKLGQDLLQMQTDYKPAGAA